MARESTAATEARSRRTSRERLHELAAHRSKKVRYAVASNPSTSPSDLSALSRDESPEVVWGAAGNLALPKADEEFLAGTEDVAVRRILAVKSFREESNLPDTVQRLLASDDDREVREGMALSTNLSEVHAGLTADPEPRVRAHTALNFLLTAEQSHALARDRSRVVRRMLASSPLGPFPTNDDLLLLARDKSVDVRWAVAARQDLPEDIRQVLVDDPHPDVRAQASRHLSGDS